MHDRTALDQTTTLAVDAAAITPVFHTCTTTRARFLLSFKGKSGVQVAELGPSERKIVGRAAPADLVVDDASLSRQHARISWREQGVLVEDLASKNGTSHDGALIDSCLVQPGMEVAMGHVVMVVRHAQDSERRGFEHVDRFLNRIDDELLRARTLKRPLSLIMIRALAKETNEHEQADGWWLRVRAELRPIDTIAVYAPGVLAILLPELTPVESAFVAHSLVKKQPAEPSLVCGVATLQGVARSSHELLEAASRASRKASPATPVVQAHACEHVTQSREPLILHASMQELYRTARRVASHAAPVLILGETGTGKELLARYVHDAGVRRDQPFRAINCGAIPANLVESVLFGHERGAFTGANELRKGVFEEAHGGTLFLDEVGELPLPAQAALLRVSETKQLTRVGGTRVIDVDVRIVSATHCDPDGMVAAKTFRQDLYHRLNLVTLRVPALRERVEEIEPLAQRFLKASAAGLQTAARTITADALEALRSYGWPGNVRELRNVIERAVMLSDGASLEVADLPERVRSTCVLSDTRAATGRFADLVRSYEMRLIREALASADGNQTKAAELLDMPLRTLVYKIRSYGLRSNAGQAATN